MDKCICNTNNHQFELYLLFNYNWFCVIFFIINFIQFGGSNKRGKKYSYGKRNLPSSTTCKEKIVLILKKIIFLILVLFFQNNAFSKEMILDQLKNPKLTNQSQQWNFITDQVMGGVSTGKFRVEVVDKVMCYRMTGDVSTKNNGGFIQIRTKLIPEINSKNYNGIYIKVYGNEKNYNIHLRTGLTLAPWQYYSYTFATTKNWSEIRAPFEQFKKSNFYQPKSIFGQNIKSVGIVAGFDDFKSDICLSEIGFY